MTRCAARKMILVGLSGLLVHISTPAAELRVAAPLISLPWSGAGFIEESVRYLAWQLPEDQIILEWERTQDIPRLMKEGRYDLAILPSMVLEYKWETSLRALSSMASRRAPDPDRGAAGVFVVREDRPWMTVLDLHGVRAAASDKSHVGGYLACAAELANLGWEAERFFSSLELYGVLNDRRMLDALRDGRIDVAMLRAGYFEDVKEASGRDAMKGLRVISPQADQLSDVHSTRTYPGLTVYSGEHVDPKIIHRVLSTLLSKPLNGWGQYWTVPAHQEGIDDLARTLKIGSYSYLKDWSIQRIWREYRTPITVLIMLLAGLLMHSWRTEVLVRKRTAELRKAMEHQLRAERALQVKNERIQALEKDIVIGHMSSIFAHEMNLPLGAMRNVLHGMRVSIDDVLGIVDEKTASLLLELDHGMQVIQKQLSRAVDIVNRVRAYARNPRTQAEIIDLNASVDAVAKKLQARTSREVGVRLMNGHAWVRCEPLELEIVLQNLLKNAIEASAEADTGIRVSVIEKPDSIAVEIENRCSGPADAIVSLLNQGKMPSSKAEGLGLGLKIAASLIERYEGGLEYTALPDSCIRTVLTLPMARKGQEEQGGARA